MDHEDVLVAGILGMMGKFGVSEFSMSVRSELESHIANEDAPNQLVVTFARETGILTLKLQ